MITKEKIIEILHSHSYYVEDQAGNHLIVVDDDSWDEIAEQLKNCSIPNVVGQSEQLVAFVEWLENKSDHSIDRGWIEEYIEATNLDHFVNVNKMV